MINKYASFIVIENTFSIGNAFKILSYHSKCEPEKGNDNDTEKNNNR